MGELRQAWLLMYLRNLFLQDIKLLSDCLYFVGG